MFESAALGRSYPAKEYAALKTTWHEAVQGAGTGIEHKLPVLITIAGVDGSGAARANMLSEWMDAKTIRNHVFWMQTDEERTCLKRQFWNKPAPPEAKWGLLGWLVWWHHQAFLLRRYRREGVQCVDGTLEEA
ncbi:MAG: hypothetical protein ACLUDQ_04625 [Bilophila wadsworthia]